MFHPQVSAKNTTKSARFLALFLLLVTSFFVIGCTSSTKEGSRPLAQDPAIHSGKLENGMSYFIQKNTEPANRIVLRLVIEAGSNMEEDDQQGVAHLLEHLAFNGSKNFERNQLVDYFESIGMNFGADVNAYTSFDETVYMLEVPADDPSMLETGMLVFHDWACGLTLAQEELDKERGVVVEEWRLGRGLQGRINDAQTPFLLKDSRYAERLPIGKMDVIQNIPRQRVVDFYEKWYRPELMSVVVVGDVEPKKIEKLIQDVMGDIPPSETPIQPEKYEVPIQSEPAVLVLRDPEQPYELVQILEQKESQPITTVEDVRQSMINRITSSIFNQRLSAITQSGNAPWIDAAIASQYITNHAKFNFLGLLPITNHFDKGFSTLMDEFLRYKEFGAVQGELDRAKQSYMASAEQTWKNKDKISSSQIASDIVGSILTDDVLISVEESYKLTKELLPTISLKEIDEAAATWFKNLGTLFFAVIPEKTTNFPSDQEILSLWQNYKPQQPLEPYAEDEVSSELMEAPSKKGKATLVGNLPGTDIQSYKLSNGAQLLLKKTDFKNNEIVFNAVSTGGLSLVSDQDYPSGTVATDYADLSGINGFTPTDLQKKLAGKQISLGFHILDYSEQLTGTTTTQDLETFMQLIYLQFTAADFTDTAWATLSNYINLEAESHGSQPRDLFFDAVMKTIYGDSIRKASLTKDYAKKIEQEKAQEVFEQRFADASDFTFIFTGDFNTKEILNLAETYLATLPATNSKEKARWQEPAFPQGIEKVVVHKGLEEQSQVFIAFGGELPQVDAAQAYQESEMLSMLKNLLDIRLRETIREDKSGTYGVSVSASMILVPQRNFMVDISFGCQPGREQELTDEILKEIENLRTNLVDQSYVTKLQESYRRSMETALKTNSYWGRMAGSSVLRGFPTTTITDSKTIPSMINPGTLRQLAQTYLDPTNYVVVFLEPETRR